LFISSSFFCRQRHMPCGTGAIAEWFTELAAECLRPQVGLQRR